MTVSLMSLLGGNVNLSASNGSEEAGTVTLTSNSDAAFDTVMAATELQEISAEKLRSFFVAHGKEMPDALKNDKNITAGQVLAQMIATNDGDGKKLPGNLMMALQEVLPQDVVDSVEQALTNLQNMEDDNSELLAQLPQRELTPDELSELVQETGLPPIVIFAALQDTPAASPNLAHAMVEDMGAAEADANLPLPRANGLPGVKADANTDEAPVTPQEGEMTAESEMDARMSSRLAAVDFSAMDENKRDVIKRIVDVLRGEKAQTEFNWNGVAKAAAVTGDQKVADVAAKTQLNPVVGDAETHESNVTRLNVPAPAAPAHSQAQPQSHGTTHPQSQQQSQQDAEVVPFISTNGKSAGVQPQAAKGIPAPQPEINAIADGAISAPQTATQTTDGPQQTPSFAASLEQSSALRGAGTADNVATHLRHQPATQQSPVEQVSVHVGKALADGSSKMEIHLKPAELGRVDVRIETDADGRSHVFVTADKRDTLDMLQRDVRGLERALADAGLKADSNSLSFNLRGGDAHQHAQGDNNGRQAKPAFDLNGNYDDLDDRIGESEMALSYDAGRAYRLNIDRGVDISV